MYNNVPFLKNITAKYNENTYFKNESFYSSLGFVGAVGFIIACVIIFIFLSKKVASSINVKEEEKKSKFTISDINMVRVNFSAFLILVLVLYMIINFIRNYIGGAYGRQLCKVTKGICYPG